MATTCHSNFLSTYSQLQLPTKLPFRVHSPLVCARKGLSKYFREHSCNLSIKPIWVVQQSRFNVSCEINMALGEPGEPEKINIDHFVSKAKKLWDSCPQPVKSFPWDRALDNFIQLMIDLVVTVSKYLCGPLLLISSLSEMSYCARQKKLFLVPFPLLFGIALASVLTETALEISPLLKDAEVPWHLIVIATVFALIKLPGPYYPYWGRIFIPHLANGVLWRCLWLAFLWSRRPKKGTWSNIPPISVDGGN
ncbi:hypothetical protein K2173_002303 [Erythroxylum novogranatense]|uniref:Embryo defective n=1 Tax=Erythroxylum novogranatense TaxID=1862640 RepID=A0AAV8T9N0_9ROSI|nr:hypothetical protein K2173_002303 [Erythroxylum novogranatense]